MKFKVGDKVRVKGLDEIIKAKEVTNNFGGLDWDDNMNNYCENVLTIDSASSGAYHMIEDHGNWWWTDVMLENDVVAIPMWPTAEDTRKVKEAADKLPAIKSDPVEHPSHYANSSIECWDAIKASMTNEAFCGYLKGNVQKYIWRYEKKVAPVEDLRKASVYLNKLIEELNDNTPNS